MVGFGLNLYLDWLVKDFLGVEDFKDMLSKSEGFAFLCAGFSGGCVNLRID